MFWCDLRSGRLPSKGAGAPETAGHEEAGWQCAGVWLLQRRLAQPQQLHFEKVFPAFGGRQSFAQRDATAAELKQWHRHRITVMKKEQQET